MAGRRTQPPTQAVEPKSGSKRPVRGAKSKAKRVAKNASEEFGKKTIALVYDFDGTLSPRPMQEYAFMPKIGIDPQDFWDESNKIAREQQADPLITYMHLLYKKAKEKGVRIDREDLVAQGRDVDLFPGVTNWFAAIKDYISEHPASHGVELRHYLISSGLTEIIEGTSIRGEFHNVFASEYWFDAYDLPYPKRVITDTGKTQYIFRINKGIEDLDQSINEHMPEGRRPVPFLNMVYFGDGDTDVPSMAVMRKNGGYAVAVHPPGKAVENCIKLFQAQRCDFFAPADYRVGSDLYKRTCLLLDRILADIRIGEEVWQMEQATKAGSK
ncbi:MAG: haloacid dehalogenase-like hydrolase [Hyphomicrobiaceae bacterium TMED74]|nr:haloacid dehalogenase-like hydrolase [Filomicrobium sp.]RPG39998.1 MAG: haloacid dehalogenase-like hydrolase [Hyphomicrobiaceae bacterium TMED74]